MLLTPHAVAGAAIAAVVRHPAALPLAAAGHYLLDMVPHWQETLAPYRPHRGTWIRIPIDIALAVLLVRRMAVGNRKERRRVVLGALAGVAPDVDSLVLFSPDLYEGKGMAARYLRWHGRIQRETSSPLGLLPQAAVVLLGLTIARRLPA